MSKKPIANLGGLVTVDAPSSVDVSHTLAPQPTGLSPTDVAPSAVPRAVKPPAVKLKKAGFLVHPRALQQFDILKAELAGDDRKNVGVRLIGEALNLLFTKYGKPTVHLDI